MKPHYTNTKNPIDFPLMENVMNERIKLLAHQADWDDEFREDFDIEKFAELIVRECVEQVWYTREDGINGNVSEVIKERMKQHFGVEE